MPADSRDEFLTVAEVAQLLRLNQQTVRNWIDQGSIPAIRVGCCLRLVGHMKRSWTPIFGDVKASFPPAADVLWGLYGLRPVRKCDIELSEEPIDRLVELSAHCGLLAFVGATGLAEPQRKCGRRSGGGCGRRAVSPRS
jgi:excisionase family DNA binding protein